MTTDLYPVDNIKVECAFTTAPDDPAPWWTDITAWVDLTAGVSITTGRGDEYATVQTGFCSVALDNSDGRFTPGNVSSPYYPNVKIRKKIRVSYTNPTGGPISYRFTGYVEEWPVAWPGGNAYSSSQVTAVDRFKRLGAVAPLKSIIEQEYLSDVPVAYFTLGEASGTTAGDISKFLGSPLGTVQVGSGGALTFGANTGPGTDGMSAPAFAPVNVTNGKYLSGAIGQVGFSGMTLEAFVLTSAAVQQTALRLVGNFGEWVEISTTAAGKVSATDFNPFTGAANFTLTSAASFNNGATHHVALIQSIAASVITVTLVVDGVNVGSTTYAGDYGMSYIQLNVGGNGAGALFTGTISHVAATSGPWTVARLLSHSNAGLTGFSGERSDQRIARLAGYAGVLAAEMSLEVGSSTSIAHFDITGMAPLQAMQDVAATEGGVLFVDGTGLLTFHARSHRYNAASAMTIAATDIDPSLRFVTNDALLVNDVTAGRPSGATVRAVNAASVLAYGNMSPPGGPIVLLTTSDAEVADAANWKANQSAEVNPRLPNLTIDLLTSPALTASALLLGLGSRVTVSGLPAQAPASSVDSFIEGWTETITSKGWALAWNTSPAAGSSVWALDSALYSQLGVSTRLAY